MPRGVAAKAHSALRTGGGVKPVFRGGDLATMLGGRDWHCADSPEWSALSYCIGNRQPSVRPSLVRGTAPGSVGAQNAGWESLESLPNLPIWAHVSPSGYPGYAWEFAGTWEWNAVGVPARMLQGSFPDNPARSSQPRKVPELHTAAWGEPAGPCAGCIPQNHLRSPLPPAGHPVTGAGRTDRPLMLPLPTWSGTGSGEGGGLRLYPRGLHLTNQMRSTAEMPLPAGTLLALALCCWLHSTHSLPLATTNSAMVKAPLLLNSINLSALSGPIPSKHCKSLGELEYKLMRRGEPPLAILAKPVGSYAREVRISYLFCCVLVCSLAKWLVR